MSRVPFNPSPTFETLLARVEQRVGLQFPRKRQESAWSIIHRVMQAEGYKDLPAYFKHLLTTPDAFDRLVDDLTIGETYFFRNPRQFEILHNEILPALANNDSHRPLRIWSAACASGEEPYSLAILLKEMNLIDRAEILATDISREALNRARNGRYRQWSLRDDYQTWAKRYLKRDGSMYVLDASIKNHVQFAYHNLAGDQESDAMTGMPQWDLILCRNVLIYFDLETVTRVADRLYRSLMPNGWLLLGAADPPLWEVAPFETVSTQEGVVYRKTEGTAGPLTHDSNGDSKTATPHQPIENIPIPNSHCATQALNPTPAMDDVLKESRQALDAGDYQQAVSIVADFSNHPLACGLQIRAMANFDVVAAAALCEKFTELHPTSVDLHYLQSTLLMNQKKVEPAIAAIRRALFLDRSLIIGHYTLGTLYQQQHNTTAATRALENAKSLCEKQSRTQSVPLAEGETVGHLLELISGKLQRLKA